MHGVPMAMCRALLLSLLLVALLPEVRCADPWEPVCSVDRGMTSISSLVDREAYTAYFGSSPSVPSACVAYQRFASESRLSAHQCPPAVPQAHRPDHRGRGHRALLQDPTFGTQPQPEPVTSDVPAAGHASGSPVQVPDTGGAGNTRKTK